jgi:hypothetical protein
VILVLVRIPIVLIMRFNLIPLEDLSDFGLVFICIILLKI